jgi:deoxyadenosine/deoxycytidine kinase
MIISLEGNIGAGKTTFLKALAAACPDYEIVLEPVDQWTAEFGGRSILQLLYEDKARWAYTFQTCVLQTIGAAVKEAQAKNKKIIITERSALTSRYVFTQMLKEGGFISEIEWALYLKLFEDYYTPLDGHIYLATDLDISAERIKERGRPGETVSMEYLSDLEIKHRSWLSSTTLPVLTLTSTSLEGNISLVKNFMEKFSGP